MNDDGAAHTKKSRRWLTVARTIVLIVAVVTVVLFAAGLVTGLGQLQQICTGEECHPAQLSPAEAALNEQLGLSLDFYAWFTILSYTLYGSVFFIVAALILWQRSNDLITLLASFFMVMFGAGALPVIPRLGTLVFALGNAGFFPMFTLFPDGRFVPRWARWLVLGWLVYIARQFVFLPVPAGSITSGTPNPVTQVAMLIGVGFQIYRYRRVSTPIQRQQTKWVVAGFAVWFTSVAALLLSISRFPELIGSGLPAFIFSSYAFTFTGLVPLLFIPVSVGISILRYRLWDIDLIIRRALIYGVLTAALAVVYFTTVVLMQPIIQSLIGRETPLMIVGSTLLIAALFSPLRSRIQKLIDRRFYRQKYDAARTLEAFAVTVRDEVDLESLTVELVRVVDKTMQPESVSLWLREL